jgi:hypothetical protein
LFESLSIGKSFGGEKFGKEALLIFWFAMVPPAMVPSLIIMIKNKFRARMMKFTGKAHYINDISGKIRKKFGNVFADTRTQRNSTF